MGGERSPAFRFYAKDWRDVKVRRMSLAAQGAYMAILADMWVDSKDQCSILDSNQFLAKALGISVEEWMTLRNEIQHTDEPLLTEKNGRLHSRRLKDEAMKQRKYAENQSKKGVAGASKRWKKKDSSGHSTGMTEGITENSSSSSSSSSKITKKKNEVCVMPESWSISESMTAYGIEKGMTEETVHHEFERCRQHHVKKGSRFTQHGWDGAVWKTWVLSWVSYGSSQVAAPGLPPPQVKCAWVNGGKCEQYAAERSKYCPEHGATVKKAQDRRHEGQQPTRELVSLSVAGITEKIGRAM